MKTFKALRSTVAATLIVTIGLSATSAVPQTLVSQLSAAPNATGVQVPCGVISGAGATKGCTPAMLATAAGSVPNTTTVSAGGDLTGGGALSSNITITDPTTGVTAATYGSASSTSQITFNAYGKATAAASVPIVLPTTSLTGTLQAAQEPAHSGDVTNTASSLTLTLATVNSNVGNCGSATTSPVVTLNAKGLTTACAPATITPAIGSIAGTGSGFATAAAQAVNTSSGLVTGSGLGTAGALLSANNFSDLGNKATGLSNLGQNPNINFISGAHPNASTDSSGAFSTAMTNSTNNGGGITEVPAGNSYCFTAPANMQKASMLEGSLPVPQNDSTSPLMVGSRLQACANVASLLTQTTITSLLHSPNIDGMVLDGNKGSYTATNLLNWSPVNAYVTKSQFVNGSGNCIYHQRNATAAWIDWYMFNTIGGCTGTGIINQGTDGVEAFNYISGNGIDASFYSTGAYRFVGNQVEVAGTDGLDIGWDGTNAFGNHSLVANNFTQNGTWDIDWINPGVTYIAGDTVTADNFHASKGAKIGSNITGGIFSADEFTQSSGSSDIAFTDSTNTGWGIYGTAHSLSPSARFANLPSDTQVISGGTGGAWNRLQSLIVTPSTNNVPNSHSGASLEVYGGASILGATNCNSRFGVSYNNSSYDPAMLFCSTNGNAPLIDIVNGEQAAVQGFSFQYRHTNVWGINSSGNLMTVSQPFAATSTAAFGSTGQATVDASGNIATTGTFTQNGTGTSRIGSSSGGSVQFSPGTPGGSNPAGYVGIYDSAGNRAGYMGYQETIGGNSFLRLANGTYVGWSLDGSVAMPNLTSDTTLTDRTACITTAGLVYYGSGTLGICLGTSSKRYKHNLETLQPGLEDLMKLHPQRGFLNAEHGDPTKPYYWITAEDGYQAFPELTGLDTQGRPNTFDLLGLVPVMVNGIQDVVDITDDLKATNDNTADKLAKLEARIDAQDRKIAALEAKVARLSRPRHPTHHRKAA